MQSNLLERVNAQNLQSSVQASGQFQFLVQDGHQQICRHGDPNLRFHCVEARPIVVLDPQIALDPFEKQLDLPAFLVKFGDRQGAKFHVVGQEHQKRFCSASKNRIRLNVDRKFSLALGERIKRPESIRAI